MNASGRAEKHRRGRSPRVRGSLGGGLGQPRGDAGADLGGSPARPRTRGDAMQWTNLLRGSPGVLGADLRCSGSIPARAGEPSSSSAIAAGSGVDPRPSEAPPHAREVYEAAPPHARGSNCLRGLPRTRGDRPADMGFAMGLLGAPPHARGSTQAIYTDVAQGRGSPARARIDRWQCRRLARPLWLPRTRGDRPRRPLRHPRRGPAAPHARGSTRS